MSYIKPYYLIIFRVNAKIFTSELTLDCEEMFCVRQ